MGQDNDVYQVGWMGTAVLMMKTQIGLGVLSIPAVLDVLGLVPGVIILITIAIITTWSDYMVGVFKLRHPTVYGIDDVGFLLFGRVGREVFAVAFILCKYHRVLLFIIGIDFTQFGFSSPALAC